MLDLKYPKLLDNFKEYIDPKRSESASFLIWYLENYIRLDKLEAIDSVCDQSGDKGIDGIYVNENEEIIYIFQSKILQNPNATIGDTSLKEFLGTISQLETSVKIDLLLKSAGDADVAKLIKRLEISKKIDDFLKIIEDAPKSGKWKGRAKTGTKKPWFKEVSDWE